MRLSALLLLAALTGVFESPARAEDSTSTSQISVRLGLLTSSLTVGSTDNRKSETLSVPDTLEFEYEILSTNKRSFFFRGTMAYELADSRVGYLFVGGGMHFYLMGNAMTYDRSDPE